MINSSKVLSSVVISAFEFNLDSLYHCHSIVEVPKHGQIKEKTRPSLYWYALLSEETFLCKYYRAHGRTGLIYTQKILPLYDNFSPPMR